MKLGEALHILMRAAERDIRGSGMGYRSTSDEWRESVADAWVTVFRHIYKRWPEFNELHNAGISAYVTLEMK